MAMPKIVSEAEWQDARAALLVKEKAATRALDALAAERRRLPMVRIDKDYVFEGADGEARLADIFEGRRQLLVYHFMFGPGEQEPCAGCSSFTDNVGRMEHLHARDTEFALISRAPRAELEAYRQRMGWTVPWYSSYGSDFNHDLGLVSPDGRDGFALSVFLRDGDDVYRTYNTTSRGVDRLVFNNSVMDLTPYGRQEDWEDSPTGWPQHPTYG
ncbi:MAG: hypothetical protein QOG75_7467 [Mycobacterium sp.]|nr:hypothetical protein [Mycobacterium sp.]